MRKVRWLDRRVASPGPYLALCLNEAQFKDACRKIRCAPPPFVGTEWSDATVHFFNASETAIVCLKGWEGRNPVEVAGLLVHEAVHIWQEYAARIGERYPGAEQEAYAIQGISQELMAEFARQVKEIEHAG